ncbi:MAG: HlyD family efflux transporter periplasmic adaptor subunit [Lentisphaerae bacterium]|nr:HlyD family efflux transporter periplasmic adaptor subunit [Lentisphaerota bacterium]
MKKIIIAMLVLCAAALAFYWIKSYRENARLNVPGFAHGNGRLEATEVSVSVKLSGRVDEIKVNEGDLVKKGDVLVEMQKNVLNAEMLQATAQKAEAEAQLKIKTQELEIAKAAVAEKQSSFDRTKSEYERQKGMGQATTQQKLEIAEAGYRSATAELEAAQAGVAKAEAAKEAAYAACLSAEAQIARVQADIDDSTLKATKRGRIQYRVAEEGEVLNSGDSVLNLVDLTDVYMTFFLPETVAGKVKIGAEARIILDAIPDTPIPAQITYVSSVAQFTPKTVETQEEREKLMFRIKAQIKPELLEQYIEYVKTGLPGVVYVQIDPEAQWPEFLKLKSERK